MLPRPRPEIQQPHRLQLEQACPHPQGEIRCTRPRRIVPAAGADSLRCSRSPSGNQLTLFGTKCLQEANTTQGNAVQINDSTGATAQQWTFNSNGTVTNVASGLCLDAPRAGTTNGTPTIFWGCNGGSNQSRTRR